MHSTTSANGNALAEKLAACQRCDAAGWRMTPTRGKAAYRPGWQTERLGCEEMAEIIGDDPTRNIGVLLGAPSRWLIDLDLDHPLAVEMADDYLPTTGAVFGHASKRRSHWLYIVTAPTETQQHRLADRAMIVGLRSTGTQTVFPGSTHPSGELIEWDTDGEPATIDPAELSTAVAQLAEAVREKLGITPPPPKINGPTPQQHICDRAKILDRAAKYLAKMPPAISGQGGQDVAFHTACELFRFGLTDGEASRLFSEFNAGCVPPWNEKEIGHKLADAREKVTTAGEFGCRLMTNNRPPSPTRSNKHRPTDEHSEPPDEQRDDETPPHAGNNGGERISESRQRRQTRGGHLAITTKRNSPP